MILASGKVDLEYPLALLEPKISLQTCTELHPEGPPEPVEGGLTKGEAEVWDKI